MPDIVSGNLTGIKKSLLKKLEALYEIEVTRDCFISDELLTSLAAISIDIGREIAVYINRKGKLVDISVGSHNTVDLGEVKGRRGNKRTSGVRCIHTHPGGCPELSDVDLSAMDSLNLDAMAAVGCFSGQEPKLQICLNSGQKLLIKNPDPRDNLLIYGPVTNRELTELKLMETIQIIDKELTPGENGMSNSLEKAVLVALQKPSQTENSIRDSLHELSQLAKTAGVEVLWKTVQARPRPDAATYIGSGKAAEIRLEAQVLSANVIIFDDELSPAQQRNLENVIGIKIIDRTALILDIFAQRARTMEGKIQVELAQLNYLLPRLIGKGTALSRLGGGIGTRGPGETKLEVDRRRIRKRISDLNEELESVRKHRMLHRMKRKAADLPVVSLCGYTNSGKSTLLNRLTNSDVLAEDKLFATLDPTTRSLDLPNNSSIVLSDTVGFIRKIPHHLIAAFRATLEEVTESDVLLHIVDISHQAMEAQMHSVTSLINEIGAAEKPLITVFNKVDKITDPTVRASLPNRYPDGLFISAATGEGLEVLLETLAHTIPGRRIRGTYEIPYANTSLAALLHDRGKIIHKEYLPDYVLLTVDIDYPTAALVQNYKRE